MSDFPAPSYDTKKEKTVSIIIGIFIIAIIFGSIVSAIISAVYIFHGAQMEWYHVLFFILGALSFLFILYGCIAGRRAE